MSVGILLITHNRLGADLMETARSMLRATPLTVANLAVSPASDPDEILKRARELCDRLDAGSGILVLTDMFGSTPSNIACRLCDDNHQVRILAGLNLPMLIRIFNYPTLSLDALKDKALSGGHDGVLNCQEVSTHGAD
ncbi:PTS fructose transporter subunit IIA [Acidihalobacter yilgarnensis]|uniref:PTS fructose transporter subunit IIA n=1 Tax=Acidihalobacter yilgarnensis TaxID=2819280 RepID=A0A1D8IR63_9GAMM|nr:PTS fructose transporter subunit IIA [Acidihalobacter yilgarnensis]AOU99038.1 PTS fructose transporter subunit IIA [Acidihalobacter yilgarnensis]